MPKKQKKITTPAAAQGVSEENFDIFLEEIADSAAPIASDEELVRERELQIIRHADERLRAELERINVELAQLQTDRELKKSVANKVFFMLIGETAIVLIILFLQGFGTGGFSINNTTLNIFLPATILQISSMAIIITKNLFSQKEKESLQPSTNKKNEWYFLTMVVLIFAFISLLILLEYR